MRVTTPDTDHRAFLAVHFPVILLVGVAGLLAFAVAEEGVGGLTHEEVLFVTIASCLFGLACVAGTVLFALGAALVVGILHSFRYRRNLLPASMQAACYLAGYLVLWAMFGAVSGVALTALAESALVEALAQTMWIGAYEFMTVAWLIANAACAAVFIVLVSRATFGARYANR
jgi:hypothetical protein